MDEPLNPTSVHATDDVEGVAGTPPVWLKDSTFGDVMTLLAHTGCVGMLCMDPDSTIRYSQGDIFDPALGPTKGLGRRLNGLFKPHLAEERNGVFAQLLRQDQPRTIVVDMISAQELWWASKPITSAGELVGLFAVGIRPDISARFPTGLEVKRLKYVLSPGELARLTLGEMEVLRLLAMGKRREEIAAELSRTVKAIERRRTALGRKLQVEHAAELAMVGVRAGFHRMSPLELARFAEHNSGPDAGPNGLISPRA
jgi:DNA-binding CsgD family transcriptional regulator